MNPSDNNMNGQMAGSFSWAPKRQKKLPTTLFRFANLPEITSAAGLSNQNLPPTGQRNQNLPPAGPSNQNLPSAGPSNQNLAPGPNKWKSFADRLCSKTNVQSPPCTIQMGPERLPLLVKVRELPEKNQDEDTNMTSWVLLEKPTSNKNQ